MKKPRRISRLRAVWFEANRKDLIQRYIKDRSGLLWTAWLNREFESGR